MAYKEVIFQKKLIPYFRTEDEMKSVLRIIIKWQNEMIKKDRQTVSPISRLIWKQCSQSCQPYLNHAVRFTIWEKISVKKAGTIGKGKADEMDLWTKEEYLKFIEV